MTAVRTASALTAADAVGWAAELYGIEVPATPLPSERDQNFRIGTVYVL